MPSKAQASSLDNLNPDDFEIIEEVPTSLDLKKKPAGKPSVRANTARPTETGSSKARIVTPGLGGVTLVIH
jgi:hypothetical protein